MTNTKTVLLLGSYGQTNLGDDLLMYNYLELLAKMGCSDVYVNANTIELIPMAIKQKFPGMKVKLTYQTSIFQWIGIIRQADAIVYGGGTIYKELYGSTGRSKYSVILRIAVFNMVAKIFGTPVYQLHIGTGTLKTKLGKFITKLGISMATFSIFRDKSSYGLAHETLGIAESDICYTTDGLFLGQRWRTEWEAFRLPEPRGKYKALVGVNLLSDIPDWADREKYISETVGFLRGLLHDKNYVVFVPFQHKFNEHNDHEFMRKYILPQLEGYSNYVLLDYVPLEQLVGMYKTLDVFVGMRFHSLLLATVTETPFLSVAYDTKCWRFTSAADYGYAIKLEEVDEAKLRERFDALMDNRTAVKKQLREIANSNYGRAEDCIGNIDF